MAVAGIHFGNTNCCIAVCKDNRTEVVSNETGERVLPACVGYTGEEKVIGFPARNLSTRCPQSVINNIKFLIGRSHLEETFREKVGKRCSCKMVIQNDCPCFEVSFGESSVFVSPTEASQFVLTKLLENAEAIGGADLEDSVLTVPIWFTEKQRIELSEACESTGFNVLRVISEPAAALLAYGLGQEDSYENSMVLVFRLGGTSVDATLVEINSGMYRVIASKVNQDLGGDSYDEVLVKLLMKEFYRKFKLDIEDNKKALRKLKVTAEQCKCALSNMNNSMCSVDSLHDGIDFSCQVTRAKFESHCAELFARSFEIVTDLLKEGEILPSDISKVIFVGGSTRMPKIRQIFSEKFPNAELLLSIKPEEVIAIGAAKQAEIILGKEEIDFADLTCPINCISKSLALEVLNEEQISSFEIIIRKYTPAPFRKRHSFESLSDHTKLSLRFYEINPGKDGSSNDRHLIAKVVLNDVKKGSKITSTLEMTRDCSLHISVTDEEQKRTESINIEPAS
ncbi:heat shock 70 kDa protein 14-like [Rhopilema esculentum]|uniref:heat shock 70 kDa protein 14-like n=1 Tax=Rhopilema esculentum TaxID=499914 RepID=UPI0031DE0FF5|eukprot:gene5069-182_t